MQPDDPRHGTTAGYQAHRRAKQPACDDCRRAAANYERYRHYDEHLGRPRKVSSIGVARRIRALQAIGWSMDDIAREGGWKDRDSIWYFVRGGSGSCNKVTAERVDRVFRRLCMTPGPSKITAARARRAGWLPPLAWDDIDDPNEQPQVARLCVRDGCAGEVVAKGVCKRHHALGAPVGSSDRVTADRILAGAWKLSCSPEVKAEVCRRFVANGGSLQELGRRTGWKPERYYRIGDAA